MLSLQQLDAANKCTEERCHHKSMKNIYIKTKITLSSVDI